MTEKFYEKFTKKASKNEAKNKRKEFNRERDRYFDAKRKGEKTEESVKASGDFKEFRKDVPDAEIKTVKKLFSAGSVPEDAEAVLNDFDKFVQNVRPLNSRQLVKLPSDINLLSHQLTDERETRRMGYMNASEELSAYVRYFTWWNLVRFTRVFSNLRENAFDLKDGDACLDIGSGPLTAVIALWLSRPELRNKKLTFYCLDLSQATMSLGEDLYLSIASKTPPSDKNAEPHWNIIRVKGGVGTSIRKKARFISCANMFNEVRESLNQSPEDAAEKQAYTLMNYAEENASIFVAEPGMPVAANFLSHLRRKMMKRGFNMISPCPHSENCPMNGEHARYGGSAKWCNFSFGTDEAPAKLLKLSKAADLPKERAVISFLVMVSENQKKGAAGNPAEKSENEMNVRIGSDPIRLPGNRTGYYACTPAGLAVIVNISHSEEIECGDFLKLKMQKKPDSLPRDKKSGGILINI